MGMLVNQRRELVDDMVANARSLSSTEGGELIGRAFCLWTGLIFLIIHTLVRRSILLHRI
jgi:hypothetical protein